MRLIVALWELRGSVHLVTGVASGLATPVAHRAARLDVLGRFGWQDSEVPEPTETDRAALQAAEALTDRPARCLATLTWGTARLAWWGAGLQGLGLVAGPAAALAFLAGGDSPGLTWRLLLTLGALPAASVVRLRRKIQETPRFSLDVRGDEASAAQATAWVTGQQPALASGAAAFAAAAILGYSSSFQRRAASGSCS